MKIMIPLIGAFFIAGWALYPEPQYRRPLSSFSAWGQT